MPPKASFLFWVSCVVLMIVNYPFNVSLWYQFWQGQCFIMVDCIENFNTLSQSVTFYYTKLFHHGIVKNTLKKAAILLSLIGGKTYKTLQDVLPICEQRGREKVCLWIASRGNVKSKIAEFNKYILSHTIVFLYFNSIRQGSTSASFAINVYITFTLSHWNSSKLWSYWEEYLSFQSFRVLNMLTF